MTDTIIIDGKAIAILIKDSVRRGLVGLNKRPVIVDVVVGQSEVTDQFVNVKKKAAESTGFGFEIRRYSADTESKFVIEGVKELSARPDVCGIVVQLPLPFDLEATKDIVTQIDLLKDIDCLKSSLMNDKSSPGFIAPVAGAVQKILQGIEDKIPADAKYVVVGRGALVGKPVIEMLSRDGVDVASVDKFTSSEEFSLAVRSADVLILGSGVPGLIKSPDVKEGVVVIDCGTSSSRGTVKGDADAGLIGTASVLSPVPGGVGPVAVACLLENALKASLSL